MTGTMDGMGHVDSLKFIDQSKPRDGSDENNNERKAARLGKYVRKKDPVCCW
jgi:hypothetical protein